MNSKRFEISIDHEMLKNAKTALDTCLRAAVMKAISTGSDEGSASLKISFEIFSTLDDASGEFKRRPIIKFRAGYSVPMKEGVDGTIAEGSTLLQGANGYMLINDQVSMDELLEDQAE